MIIVIIPIIIMIHIVDGKLGVGLYQRQRQGNCNNYHRRHHIIVMTIILIASIIVISASASLIMSITNLIMTTITVLMIKSNGGLGVPT